MRYVEELQETCGRGCVGQAITRCCACVGVEGFTKVSTGKCGCASLGPKS